MITRSGRNLLGQFDGLLAVAGLADDLVALFAEHLGEVQPDERLVLGDQHAVRLVASRVGRRPGHATIVAWPAPDQRAAGASNSALSAAPAILYGGIVAARREPSYPNWQRKRIQNPCSVSSSLTEGTRKTVQR